MKIAIVTHKFVKGEGQGRVNYEIAKKAINQNNKTILIASEIDENLKKNENITHKIIDVKKWPTDLIKNLIFAYKSSKWLKKNKEQYDILIANGFITFCPSEINQVHFVHSSWIKSQFHPFKIKKSFYGLYQWIYNRLNSYLEKKSFNKSKIIVAVSNKVKNELIQIGVAKEKIKIILNGVDTNEFFPKKVNRKYLKIPDKVPLALFIGDIKTKRKNLDTVLKALKYVPNLNLIVVGDTKNSPYIRLTEKLKLTKKVHFLGYRKDVSNIMQAVDFFVFPSRYETAGLVVLEAMASGLPIITAKTVGCSEIITPECGIILGNPNDIKALAKTMNELMNNIKKRKSMGKAARKIAERYTWNIMAKKYINLFQKQINEN